ncbi:MAG TPA: LacI family DNA-binding transcriptional regulator [Capsulimonadaceae bacterium]|jgi:DNA-binding LacI/PurR family transcriptional regulator
MVTIADIASECGTSPATVSKIMNGNDRKISHLTRERVNEAVRRMGYKPNAAARGLRKQRASCIGIYMQPHAISTRYHGSLVDAILLEAEARGQGVMLFTSIAKAQGDPRRLMFADGRCDGILVLSTPEADLLPIVEQASIPCLCIHNGVLPGGQSSIDIDNRQAGYLLAKHLIEAGHRRIAFFHDGVNKPFSVLRFEGYRDALQSAGIPLDPRLVLDGVSNLMDGYQQALRVAADTDLGVTALLCATDVLALRAIQALRDTGKSVPSDLSVAGIDGIFDGQTSSPPLTTISQRSDKLGIEAVRLLMERIEHPDRAAAHTVWPVELVVRESVGPTATIRA